MPGASEGGRHRGLALRSAAPDERDDQQERKETDRHGGDLRKWENRHRYSVHSVHSAQRETTTGITQHRVHIRLTTVGSADGCGEAR